MNEIITTSCECRKLESGIFDIVWHKADRAAVDTYMDYIASVYDMSDANMLTRWLHHDGGGGLPSLNYLLSKTRDLERRYPRRPRTRTAILYSSGMKLMVLNGAIILANTLGRDVTRFFPLRDHTPAMTWLMQDK